MSTDALLSTLGWVFLILGVVMLIVTVAIFFGFRIPELWKDVSGSLEQKQIEEIRQKSTLAARQKNKVNVFEELERKAKPRRNNTQSLNLSTTTGFIKSAPKASNAGTTLLKNNNKTNPNFLIEKNIIFVSTNEIV